ncbi:MAG: hypothetical protein PHF67_04740 [Candidatus Nanoarchaeia archaeon]|nr:hypothetical protein [Candidatus Nanoarchaeia archaeon]
MSLFAILFLSSGILAEDIAYVVKSSSSTTVDENAIKVILTEMGYSYRIIDDSQVGSTDFSQYRMILLGDGIIDNVPVNSHSSLILNRYYYDFCGSSKTTESPSQPYSIDNGWGDIITLGVPLRTESYLSGGANTINYLRGLSSGCNKVSSLYSDWTKYVIVSKDNPRRVFFGMPLASYWTSDSRQLFKNSLKWVIGDVCTDSDGDYYIKESTDLSLCGDICGPSHSEICDGNNDCDDNSNSKWQYLEGYADDDGDSFGAGALIDVCSGDYLPISYSEDNSDCNDNNFNVNPLARELEYNGIDDDCNGYDLLDVDNDFYCKLGYTIINKSLQCPLETGTIGTDCRDSDASYNPGSTDINKNCQNKAPIIQPITKITATEGSTITLTVHATDFENSSLTYSINDSIKFSKNANVFTWATGYLDNGNYIFKISVSDGNLTTYIDVEVEVIDRNQPPSFNEMTCVENILEDSEYSCEISAEDFENDSFNFSVVGENKLHCSFQNNTLIYKPYQDYFGNASCTIKVSDAYGHNLQSLNVHVENVNDAPIISEYSPSIARILNNTNQSFRITIRNVDNDNITVSWFLNNQMVGYGNTYNFSADRGSYNLTAIASDGEFSTPNSWNVFVGFIEELTCNEAHGFLCGSNEICTGNLLGVLDSESCCNLACSEKPPTFKDINKKCQNKSNELQITFKDISQMDKFTIGETITKKIEIKNNATINLDVVLEIYIYDLSRDKIINKQKFSFNMAGKTYKIQNFEMNLPWDIDDKDKFAVFVNVKGNGETDSCNSDYIKIDPERTFNKLLIETAWMDEGEISCGDSVDLYARVRNIGSDEQTVVLKFTNSLLKIKETTDEFLLEGYGNNDDSEKITLNLNVPENAKAGNYTIEIKALSDTPGLEDSYDFEIELGECKNEESSSTNMEVIKLDNTNNFQIFEDPKNKNLILWNSVIVFLVLGFLFMAVLHKGIKRKKTKKEVEREINKIIKRKNIRNKVKKQKKKGKR